MPERVHRDPPDSPRRAAFPSTCWSRLLAAGDPARRTAALATLATEYRAAAAAYLRAACSLSVADADDLAQDFFAHVVATDWLERADPRRGTFRAFLKQSLRNFAADAARAVRAAKRGGGRTARSLDADDGGELADPNAREPERELDRKFRRALIENALEDVRADFESQGRARQFEAFSAYFLNDDGIDYRAIGERLGLTPAEVSNALQRTKASFREKLRARVAETVRSEDELEAELAWLFGKPRR